MIWFFLYPIRGTIHPPVLPEYHPIRRAFYHHGLLVSTYWLCSLFASVLVSVTVLYTFFIGSPAFSTLPGHGWTYAHTFDSGQGLVEDVVVRRVWIHGDHMGALDPHVLREALQIQNALIYDRFPSAPLERSSYDMREAYPDSCHDQLGDDSTSTWGFHSPLMYWNCSDHAIQSDMNHLHTIQQGSELQSYRNLTLLPASVFSGKTFAGKRLTEADALVITHLDTSLSQGATKWDARMVKLAAEYNYRWLFYPPSGIMATNQLYEYQREQISAWDVTVVGSIYVIISLFLIYRLQDAPAVRSRLGLVAAMVTDMAISIIASFSICSLLKVDLSRIPRELYPFVVVVIGIENMLRLVNAALDQPPQTEPTKRIAIAMAKAGHVSLASTTQILLVLWMISRIVSSSIQAFCIFVGCALLFDFCFHLVFFVAVLSVDVQRMELQDSLDRVESKGDGQEARKTQAWLDALLRGKLPLTSRVLGSVISICFVLGLNMHMTDLKTFIRAIWDRTMELIPGHVIDSKQSQFSVVPPSINQARTPQEWLRLQDHQFAQEVIESIKPGARSMLARVYEPVVIVLKGSDRGISQTSQGLFRHTWLTMNGHILPVLFIISVFIGLLGPLMDYLLWDNRTDAEKEAQNRDKHDLVHTRKLPTVHSLDIYRLGANAQGHVVSVGLDRAVVGYCLNASLQKYRVDASAVPDNKHFGLWPISQIVIDEAGDNTAVCSSRHNIGFWNNSSQEWSQMEGVRSPTSPPCLMAFVKLNTHADEDEYFVVVLPDGSVNLSIPATGELINKRQLTSQIISAILVQNASGTHVVCLSKNGQMQIASIGSIQSSAVQLHGFEDFSPNSSTGEAARAMNYIQAFNIIVVVRADSVDLLDFTTRLRVGQIFTTFKILATTVRVLHSLVKECRNCRSPAAYSLSIVYTESRSRDVILKTFTATEGEHPLICFHPTTNSSFASCQAIDRCKVVEKFVRDPGQWDITKSQFIVGIRQRPSTVEYSDTKAYTSSFKSITTALPDSNAVQLRRKSATKSVAEHRSTTSATGFEIWTISPTTEMITSPITYDKDDLLVLSPGPMASLGARSVVIAIGNSLRVITVGTDRIEEATSDVWFGGAITNGKPKFKDLKKRKAVNTIASQR